jgi:hypothetical protein
MGIGKNDLPISGFDRLEKHRRRTLASGFPSI